MSEILVGAAEGTGKALGMSEVFIGIVFLAIVGGAAESGSAIAMARKNKLDLTIGIAMGSSIQIALFVAPVLVLVSGVDRPAAAGAVFQPRGDRDAPPRRADRRHRGGRRPVELVQGRSAHPRLRDDRDALLLPPGWGALIL